MGKIAGAGSSNVDLTGFAPHLPVAGETVTGSELRIGPGGKGSNQMTAARRAGSEVAFVSAVGDDVLSDVLTKHFAESKIDTKYIKVHKGAATACALIEIDGQTAQNRIIVLTEILQTITAADVKEAEADFADADIVLVQFETSKESILACKELAGKYGKRFVVNPAPYMEMPDGFYRGVYLVTPNETEAEYLTGVAVTDLDSARAAGRKLIEMGAEHAVITLGVNGALYTDGKDFIHVPGIKVKAVETTGAGDAFNGGLVTALAEGCDWKTALAFANCTGALSVTRKGAGAAMPYRAEILALLQKEYGITL